MSKDYYNILGVAKGSSPEEIKKAFRKKAHQYHPDKQTGDEAKFKEINEAYQVLGDKQKRERYDQYGTAEDFGGGGSGQTWSNTAGFGFGDFDLGDLFGSAFGGRRKKHGPQRGDDVQTEITLQFEEAVSGGLKSITLYRVQTCSECKGNGAKPGTRITACGDCSGSGERIHAQQTPFGVFQTKTTCRSCQGEGRSFDVPCPTCHGNGAERKEKSLSINIPAGIDNGETIRVTGEGNAGAKGGGAGDLYIEVRVAASTKFVREGYDILSKVYISYPTAVLGGKIDVETLDGKVILKIPAGTESGSLQRLKGRGITKLHGRGHGDHLVQVQINVVKNPSRSAKKILKQLETEL